jgi:hypothetical protein
MSSFEDRQKQGRDTSVASFKIIIHKSLLMAFPFMCLVLHACFINWVKGIA